MILTIFQSYKERLTELHCSDVSEEYLLKAAEQLDKKYESSDIFIMELKLMFKDELRTFKVYRNDIYNRCARGMMEQIIEDIKESKYTVMKNAVQFTFEDLVGWNLVNAFTTGEWRSHYMTFEKDGKLKQFVAKVVNGDLHRFYNFEHDGERHWHSNPECRQSWDGNMYDISQILKGKVTSIDGNMVTTEMGKFGWDSFYYEHKTVMLECEEITECPLSEPLEYEFKGRSIDMADSEAYRETKYYCVDVLSGGIPSDHYKNDNDFALWFDVVDKRTGMSVASFFGDKHYPYKELWKEESRVINDITPLISKMNSERAFDKLDGFVCEKVSKLKISLES